jgi:hypothetical protein
MDSIRFQRIAYAIRSLGTSTSSSKLAHDINKSKNNTVDVPIDNTDISLQNLKNAILPRLAVLSMSDKNLRIQAATILSQEVLCWQYGQQIIYHPEFYLVIERLTHLMLDNSAMSDLLEDILTYVASKQENKE